MRDSEFKLKELSQAEYCDGVSRGCHNMTLSRDMTHASRGAPLTSLHPGLHQTLLPLSPHLVCWDMHFVLAGAGNINNII